MDYLQHSIDSRQLTNGGPLQQVLAARLRDITNSKLNILPAASGTAALHALCAGWSLKFGRPLRWATQAFTFPPSMQGPLAEAIVIDADAHSCGPSLSLLSQHIDIIDGIVVTNVFGTQTDVLAYEQWCRKHNKLLIFDNAATPVGVSPDGRCIHDIGNGAIISLHETKPIGRGEGGAIFASPEISKFVKQAMNFGFQETGSGRRGSRLCSNYRASDFAAAVILDHLDTVIEFNWAARFTDLAAVAVDALERHNLSLKYELKAPTIPSCLLIQLRNDMTGSVDSIIETLNGSPYFIEVKHYYRPLVEEHLAPEAWRTYSSTICLPFHLDLTAQDIEYMVQSLVAVLGACVTKLSKKLTI